MQSPAAGRLFQRPGTDTVPLIDRPDAVWADLRGEIVDAIVNHPRSLQTRIGPSELGDPCDRAILNKLAGSPEPDRGPAWKPTVGTAIHAWLEDVLGRSLVNHTTGTDGCQFPCDGPTTPGRHRPRWLLEQRVTVGTVGGVDITGSCDLFDTVTGVVVDWKTKGRRTLQQHKKNGPGKTYRRQAHLYGRGWELAGHRVTAVMDVFLPRDGELADAFVWSEPYDQQIAIDTVARADRLAGELQALQSVFPPEQALQLALSQHPDLCDDEWCRWCRPPHQLNSRPGHGTPAAPKAPRTLAAFRNSA